MSVQYEENNFDFDFDFLNPSSNISVVSDRTEKPERPRKAILIVKKKIVATDSLIRRYYEKKEEVEQYERTLHTAKEECKQSCLQYNNIAEKYQLLENEVATLRHEHAEMQEKYDRSENLFEAIQSHANQLQTLVKENETTIDSLTKENRIQKENVKECEKNVTTLKKENADLMKDICLMRDIICGRKKLNKRSKLILEKYDKCYASDDDGPELGDDSDTDFDNTYVLSPTKIQNLAIESAIKNSSKGVMSKDDNEHDSDCSNELASRDTGRGSSLAFSDGEKCFNSPDYFLNHSPINTHNEKEKINYVDVATSPIRSSQDVHNIRSPVSNVETIQIVLSPINTIDTSETECNIEADSEHNHVDIGTSSFDNDKIIRPKACKTYSKLSNNKKIPTVISQNAVDVCKSPENASVANATSNCPVIFEDNNMITDNDSGNREIVNEKECLELNNSNHFDEINNGDCEIEMILNKMRFNRTLITPIPSTPSKSRNTLSLPDKSSKISHRGEHVCKEAAQAKEENKILFEKYTKLAQDIAMIKDILKNKFSLEDLQPNRQSVIDNNVNNNNNLKNCEENNINSMDMDLISLDDLLPSHESIRKEVFDSSGNFDNCDKIIVTSTDSETFDVININRKSLDSESIDNNNMESCRGYVATSKNLVGVPFMEETTTITEKRTSTNSIEDSIETSTQSTVSPELFSLNYPPIPVCSGNQRNSESVSNSLHVEYHDNTNIVDNLIETEKLDENNDQKQYNMENVHDKVTHNKCKKLSKLDKFRKNLVPKSKIKNKTITINKKRIKPKQISLHKKIVNENDSVATLNSKKVYEKAVQIMSELKSQQKIGKSKEHSPGKKSKVNEVTKQYDPPQNTESNILNNECIPVRQKNNVKTTDSIECNPGNHIDPSHELECGPATKHTNTSDVIECCPETQIEETGFIENANIKDTDTTGMVECSPVKHSNQTDVVEYRPVKHSIETDVVEIIPKKNSNKTDTSECSSEKHSKKMDVVECGPGKQSNKTDLIECSSAKQKNKTDMVDSRPTKHLKKNDVAECGPAKHNNKTDVGACSPAKRSNKTDVVECSPAKYSNKTDVGACSPAKRSNKTDVVECSSEKHSNKTDMVECSPAKYSNKTDVGACSPAKRSNKTDVVECSSEKHSNKTDMVECSPAKHSNKTDVVECSPAKRSNKTDVVECNPAKRSNKTDVVVCSAAIHSNTIAIDDCSSAKHSNKTDVVEYSAATHSNKLAIDDCSSAKHSNKTDVVECSRTKHIVSTDMIKCTPKKHSKNADLFECSPIKHKKKTDLFESSPLNHETTELFESNPVKHNKKKYSVECSPTKYIEASDFMQCSKELVVAVVKCDENLNGQMITSPSPKKLVARQVPRSCSKHTDSKQKKVSESENTTLNNEPTEKTPKKNMSDETVYGTRKRLKRDSIDNQEVPCKRVLRSSNLRQLTSEENGLVNSSNDNMNKKGSPETNKSKVDIINDPSVISPPSNKRVLNYSDLDIFTDNNNTSIKHEIKDQKGKSVNPNEILFCVMLNKYGKQSRKNYPKKASDSVITSIIKTLQDEINAISNMNSFEAKNAMNKLVETIQSWNFKDFMTAFVSYLKDPQRKVELFNKISSSPAPPMTKSEQILLYVITQLNSSSWETYGVLNCVLCNIEYVLFKLNRTPEFDTIESMAHFYAVLCRYFKMKSRLRLFMLDAMYCIQFKAVPLIKQCLDVWMHVLPLAHMGIAKSPLVTCLVYLLHFYKCEDRFNRVQEIRNILSRKYFYEITEWNEPKIIEMFRNAIKEIKAVPVEMKLLRIALIVISKRHGAKWCQKNIIQNLLLPMIGKDVPERVKLFCISMLGPLLKPYPVDMKVHCEIVMNLLSDALKKNPSPQMEEAIITSLIYMSKHNQTRLLQTLLTWKPQRVTLHMEVMLRDFVMEKPLKVWKAILSKIQLT